MSALLRDGRWNAQADLRFRHFKTGEPIPVSWDAFCVEDRDTGETIGLATITRDMTESRRAEQESARRPSSRPSPRNSESARCHGRHSTS